MQNQGIRSPMPPPINQEQDAHLFETYTYCRWLRIFALIDAFFALLSVISSAIIGIIALICAIAGYHGAKTLNRS